MAKPELPEDWDDAPPLTDEQIAEARRNPPKLSEAAQRALVRGKDVVVTDEHGNEITLESNAVILPHEGEA